MYHCRPNATVKAYPDSPIMLARHDSIVSEEGDYSYHPKPYGIHGEGAFSYSLPHPGPLAFAESDDGTVSAYPGGVANDHYSWPSTEIHPRRSFVSPTPSGGSWSSTDSTGWSNDRNFVASSPAMGFSPSPLPYHQSVYVAYACGGHSNEPCFDPREAQYYPDPEPVQLNYEDEMSVHAAYAITHQHPFQVMVESAEDLSPHTHGYCYEETLNATSEHSQVKLEQIDHGNEQFRNSGTPKTKRPRRQSRQSLSNISIISTTRTNVRVTKRLSPAPP
ncbi:hypothetical protein H2203_000038 [Taxawa tesnikishii (nom. ined.)]|nr:hypothetical protein H2203_000038 [Dothideales sp. JES 119]